MCFNQRGNISTINGSSLKLVDKFTYQGSSVLSTKTDINTRLAKVWIANDRLSVIWKSDLTDKIKCGFFQAAVESILLYGCTTWMLNVWRKNLTASTQECCEQYWTSPGGSTPQSSSCTATYHSPRKLRRTRHAGPCWRSDILQWTPSHIRAKIRRPARIYIQQLCADTGCSFEDLPEAMNDREGWWERVRDIRADDVTWWQWRH